MHRKTGSLDLPSFQQPPSSSQASSPTAKGANSPAVSYSVAASKPVEQAALPLLPRTKRPSFSSHRNDANAALALDLLTDVEDAIVGWHQTLRQTLLDIQTLYMAGPIVDGWLEAENRPPAHTDLDTQAAVLRHGDAEQVAAYIAKLAEQSQAATQHQGTQYRLCRLDADGRMQCQICPPEQIGVISQAIARHQQLRQLVNQKQYLEARLKSAAEALEVTRKALGIQGKPQNG